MNCARQNQINERIIEPSSKQKQLSCTQFGVLLISGIKANEQRKDRRTVNNRTALKIMMGVINDLLLNLEQCCFLDDLRGGAFAFFFSPT